MISSVGVYHAGRHRPQGYWSGETVSTLEEAVFLTGMKNTCNISNVQLKGNYCSVCLLYSIMHELTGVYFVLAEFKLGTTGGD